MSPEVMAVVTGKVMLRPGGSCGHGERGSCSTCSESPVGFSEGEVWCGRIKSLD